jgi:hypothetical protein
VRSATGAKTPVVLLLNESFFVQLLHKLEQILYHFCPYTSFLRTTYIETLR